MINPLATNILKGGQYTAGTLIKQILKDSMAGNGQTYGFPKFINPYPDYSAMGGNQRTIGYNPYPVMDVSAWISAAKDSAREMMIEREMLLKNTGSDPLTANQISNNYNIDALYSFLQWINDDYAIITGDMQYSKDIAPLSFQYLAMHGVYLDAKSYPQGQSVGDTFSKLLVGPLIQPYNPEQIAVASFIRSARIAAKQVANAGKVLTAVQTGQSTGIPALDIAAATVKQQLSNPIALDPTLPVIGVKNVDFAATTNTQRAQELAIAAVQQNVDIPVQKTTDTQNAAVANLLAYWKKNAPKVELLLEFNKHLTQAILDKDWSMLQNSPLVNLRVTPQLKPLPQMGFFAKYGQWIGFALMLIPGGQGVGAAALTAATVINKVQTAKSIQQFKNAIEVPTSYFEPSYKPMPFFVVLPLDQAQVTVKKPWYLPMLSYKFRDETGGLYNPFK